MFDFEEVEGFGDDEVDEVVDCFWHEVEAWVGGHDDGAGEGEGFHGADVDEGEG